MGYETSHTCESCHTRHESRHMRHESGHTSHDRQKHDAHDISFTCVMRMSKVRIDEHMTVRRDRDGVRVGQADV